MTKGEMLKQYGHTIERVAHELEALSGMMGLAASHEAGALIMSLQRDAKNVRRLSTWAGMETDMTFKEPL